MKVVAGFAAVCCWWWLVGNATDVGISATLEKLNPPHHDVGETMSPSVSATSGGRTATLTSGFDFQHRVFSSDLQ